jgi:anti-sigma factor RsiW
MRCEDAQDLVSAWLDNELSDADAAAIAEHEAQCQACHAYVEDLRSFSAEMGTWGREKAPPGLEERVRNALADAPEIEQAPPAETSPEVKRKPANEAGGTVVPFRPGRRRSNVIRQAASLAAVCLLSVFGTWAVMREPGTVPETEHDVVAAHVRSLIQNSPIQVASSDTHTVRPWFNGKVEFAPPVKDLAAEGFPLVGGRLDFVDGHRVATLVYRHQLHTISVFVWPVGSSAATPSAKTPVDGLNVLSWTEDGMVWWAVSDLEPGELQQLRALL